jgi:transcriptional regulator with XRE-family HTH domain
MLAISFMLWYNVYINEWEACFMNRLKELRISSNLTLSELHEATGIARSVLSAIENGKRRMNVNHSRILAEYFSVSTDFLLGNDLATYMTFEEMLEDLFASSFDAFVEAASDSSRDSRPRLLFVCVDHLIHEELSNDDLSMINDFIQALGSKNKGIKK